MKKFRHTSKWKRYCVIRAPLTEKFAELNIHHVNCVIVFWIQTTYNNFQKKCMAPSQAPLKVKLNSTAKNAVDLLTTF